jgi:hypothetical protein
VTRWQRQLRNVEEEQCQTAPQPGSQR